VLVERLLPPRLAGVISGSTNAAPPSVTAIAPSICVLYKSSYIGVVIARLRNRAHVNRAPGDTLRIVADAVDISGMSTFKFAVELIEQS
jgi:hypothetical protein